MGTVNKLDVSRLIVLFIYTFLLKANIKPGITGWAQESGRNAISWEQKFKYDVYYADNCSFALDMVIFIETMEKVFKSEGINQQGQATAEKFKGE